jgi:hypothetical protein
LNQSICFYFPYYEDSGVPILFYRMANAIALAFPDCKVSVIDFENGAMWRNLLSLSNIKKVKFETGIRVSPPEDSVLVMQAFVPYYWPQELILTANQRLFFWNLHPHNLVPSLLPLPLLRSLPMNYLLVYKLVAKLYPNLISRLQLFTTTLIDNRALFFMDRSNLELTEKYLFLTIQKGDFIPVPAESSTIKPFDIEKFELGSTVRFGWIGRLCDFKSYILVYTIKKLNEIATSFSEKKIEFHIVGDGPFGSYVREKVQECINISIVYHGSIAHQDIDKFIHTSIDILMAMGTSALEGAKLRKPTFILDPILEEVKKDYFFRLLYATTEYDLGHFIDERDYIDRNTSLEDLLKDIFENYAFHSSKSYSYFFENHNLENVKNKFLDKVLNSGLEYSMLDPLFFKKPLFLRLYNQLRGLKA